MKGFYVIGFIFIAVCIVILLVLFSSLFSYDYTYTIDVDGILYEEVKYSTRGDVIRIFYPDSGREIYIAYGQYEVLEEHKNRR